MTPKEIVSIILAYESETTEIYNQNALGCEKGIEGLIKKQVELIESFKKEVCEKQRDNCVEAYIEEINQDTDFIIQEIKNAPEPE